MAHEDWDVDEFLTGKQTPVLFGTAAIAEAARSQIFSG